MDIKTITQIVNNKHMGDDAKTSQIISVMANDENVILEMLKILQHERKSKKELIQDMNLELSRAHIFIDSYMPAVPKTKPKTAEEGFSKGFVVDKISAFYVKYKGIIRHCFNRFN